MALSVAKQAQKQKQGITLTSSNAVLKNCMRISLSSVIYSKNFFDETEFRMGKYCDIKVPLLKTESTDSGAKLFHSWLNKGVFAALDKGYIQRVYLNVHSDDPKRTDNRDNIVEQYSFTISCNSKEGQKGMFELAHIPDKTSDDGKMKMQNINGRVGESNVKRAEVKKMLRSMLRRLTLITASHEDLPDNRWITMTIVYNDTAPEEYEPEAFESADADELSKFQFAHLGLNCGSANTGHHTIALKIRSLDPEAKNGSSSGLRSDMLFDSDAEGLLKRRGNPGGINDDPAQMSESHDRPPETPSPYDSDHSESSVVTRHALAALAVTDKTPDTTTRSLPMICSQDSLYSAANENNVSRTQKPRKISRTKRSIFDSNITNEGRAKKRRTSLHPVKEEASGAGTTHSAGHYTNARKRTNRKTRRYGKNATYASRRTFR